VWCLATSVLIANEHLVAVLQRSSRWIIPAVFVALGGYVIDSSGLLTAIG
jgi:cadmium resistance protein CadD (predicted permease)